MEFRRWNKFAITEFKKTKKKKHGLLTEGFRDLQECSDHQISPVNQKFLLKIIILLFCHFQQLNSFYLIINDFNLPETLHISTVNESAIVLVTKKQKISTKQNHFGVYGKTVFLFSAFSLRSFANSYNDESTEKEAADLQRQITLHRC